MPEHPTLKDIHPDQSGTPYAEWKAEQVNKLFETHGVRRERARILPTTVEDGVEKAGRPASK